MTTGPRSMALVFSVDFFWRDEAFFWSGEDAAKLPGDKLGWSLIKSNCLLAFRYGGRSVLAYRRRGRGEAAAGVGMRRMCQDWFGLGTPSDVPNLWRNALLRFVSEQTCQQTCPRDGTSGDRFGPTGRALALLLRRRSFCAVLRPGQPSGLDLFGVILVPVPDRGCHGHVTRVGRFVILDERVVRAARA